MSFSDAANGDSAAGTAEGVAELEKNREMQA
jgi:hypothetical protein